MYVYMWKSTQTCICSTHILQAIIAIMQLHHQVIGPIPSDNDVGGKAWPLADEVSTVVTPVNEQLWFWIRLWCLFDCSMDDGFLPITGETSSFGEDRESTCKRKEASTSNGGRAVCILSSLFVFCRHYYYYYYCCYYYYWYYYMLLLYRFATMMRFAAEMNLFRCGYVRALTLFERFFPSS